MEIKLKDFETEENADFRTNPFILYKGKRIGHAYRAGDSYPLSVHDVSGKHLGRFTSKREAFKTLLVTSGVLGQEHQLGGNLFPSGDFILRIIDITMIGDPNPEAAPAVTAKVFYNTKTTFGRTSKPVNSAMMTIDINGCKFIKGGKEMKFNNQKEMMEKVLEAIGRLA